MSDTPRTDEVWDDYVAGMAAAGIRVEEDDMLRHARTLERALARQDALLRETLQVGAYGIGSTLAERIERELGEK